MKTKTYASDEKTGRYDLDIQFEFKKLPVDITYDIVIVHKGKEQVITGGAVPANSSTHWVHHTTYASKLLGEKIDVILRPSVERAEQSVDCFDIWGEEIVFKDVIVEQSR